MSDTKKPTVSEIEARFNTLSKKPWQTNGCYVWGAADEFIHTYNTPILTEFISHSKTDIPHLLDLVERAAIEIDVLLQDDYTKHMRRDDVREARDLLDELKK